MAYNLNKLHFKEVIPYEPLIHPLPNLLPQHPSVCLSAGSNFTLSRPYWNCGSQARLRGQRCRFCLEFLEFQDWYFGRQKWWKIRCFTCLHELNAFKHIFVKTPTLKFEHENITPKSQPRLPSVAKVVEAGMAQKWFYCSWGHLEPTNRCFHQHQAMGVSPTMGQWGGSDGTIRVVDQNTGRLVYAVRGRPGGVGGCADE